MCSAILIAFVLGFGFDFDVIIALVCDCVVSFVCYHT
jgi:hypothetical protein